MSTTVDPLWAELHPHEITVVTADQQLPDASGTSTTSTPVHTVLHDWNVQPVTSPDDGADVGDVELVTGRWRASGPLAPWIPADATVIWQDRTYRIDGEPAHFTGGALDHTEMTLIAWR